MKISLSDYKSFDGTYKEWAIMKCQFTATANAHGYGDYINVDYEIPEETEAGYKKYLKASSYVYNALEYSCCAGTAITIIQKFKKNREGIKAWRKLIEWMES